MAEFEPKQQNQKYCRPKCAKRFAQFRNFKKAGRTVYTRIGNEVKERLRKPKKKDDVIKTVNHMARASGMSYGKFVAQMSIKPLERK